MSRRIDARSQVLNLLSEEPQPWSSVVDALTTGTHGQHEGQVVNGQRIFVPGNLFEHRRKMGMTTEGADAALKQLLAEEVIEVIPRGKTRRKPGILFVRIVNRNPHRLGLDGRAILKHAVTT